MRRITSLPLSSHLRVIEARSVGLLAQQTSTVWTRNALLFLEIIMNSLPSNTLPREQKEIWSDDLWIPLYLKKKMTKSCWYKPLTCVCVCVCVFLGRAWWCAIVESTEIHLLHKLDCLGSSVLRCELWLQFSISSPQPYKEGRNYIFSTRGSLSLAP